jgi:hypothetical protein
MDQYTILNDRKMGVQLPRGVHPEMPQEGVVRLVRRELAEVFHQLAKQKESRIE